MVTVRRLARWIGGMTATDALHPDIQINSAYVVQYSLSVWRRVLTPLQTAHLNVTAYPHKVNPC
jgi:hypothetical protein